LDLPYSLRSLVFEYCSLSLSHRLINKRFSSFVLESIHSIRLNDWVDEDSFNKLAMWAVNVQCRMRNVKSMNLKDKYDDQELLPNRAKTLRFGDWKEITSKNIMELKGLRTYCLELPYAIKFDLSYLFGQRMVQLRFKGTSLSRSEFIKIEDLAHILNTVRELRVLEIPFCFSGLFRFLEHPERLEELRIAAISDNQLKGSKGSWTDLTPFENLTIFSCWYLDIAGSRKENNEVSFLFPSKLRELEVGCFIAVESLEKLPFELRYLKLIGSFYSYQIHKVPLVVLRWCFRFSRSWTFRRRLTFGRTWWSTCRI
jgi:hypothetical protein